MELALLEVAVRDRGPIQAKVGKALLVGSAR